MMSVCVLCTNRFVPGEPLYKFVKSATLDHDLSLIVCYVHQAFFHIVIKGNNVVVVVNYYLGSNWLACFRFSVLVCAVYY